MNTSDMLKEHHYSSGRVFYIVQCDECHVALNSGHHYSLKDLPHAEFLAAEHITSTHPDTITVQVWECQESGELIEGDARVCALVMARDAEDNPLTWRLVNEWTQEKEAITPDYIAELENEVGFYDQ